MILEFNVFKIKTLFGKSYHKVLLSSLTCDFLFLERVLLYM